MCFQGEVEIRQINGHSSEEEKEDEEKEPWPDDHSSSRYNIYHTLYHLSHMNMNFWEVNNNKYIKPEHKHLV